MSLMRLLDELRVLASNGLKYADNHYDRERYERMLELVSEHYSDAVGLPVEEVRGRFSVELGHVTPKIGSDGAIFDDDGRLLLMQRTGCGTWCLPCGWIEPSESPEEAVVREVREETGLEVSSTRLVGLFHRMASIESGPHGVVSVLYLCEVDGGTLTCSSEGQDLRYWAVEDVPAWFAHHEILARAAKRAHEDKTE
ncbi:MAG: NUDIX hydrolase N-terminal domain-containing protein [Candidatus Eisenbacteria bacterium]|nr:NUDIX hydrolase N-terminal domain-containing protein [Candidatus Eisenbacteria bacterium]